MQQPQQGQPDMYGQQTYGGPVGRGNNRDRGAGYPDSYQQPSDHGGGGSSRRYTISAAPSGENGASPSQMQGGQDGSRPESANQQDQQPQSQQVPIQGGGLGMGGNDMMGNLSQRSTGPFHRGSMGASPHGGMAGYGAELSPTHFAHRMSLGFYPMSGGSANSPGFNDPMGDLSGRGGVLPPGGVPGTQGQGPPGSQAEREEELLLNLLIARRQRSRMGGDDAKTASLTDELMRLRQGRAAAQRQGGSGSLPQMPGIPPLYADSMPGGSGVPANMYPSDGFRGHMGGDSMKADYPPFPHHHMQRHMQDMSERINRSPGRFQMFDARMGGDMRDYSDRGMGGFKRPMGMGSMGMHPGMGMVYTPEAMAYQMGMDIPQPPIDQPPTKKKRTHKKKPADMPRRPLSAYNLFFSEERERILKEIERKEKKKEGKEIEEEEDKDENKKNQERPKALLRPLIPSQKKRRPHRKTHGKISFQELARMVGERWKNLSDEDRKYYQGLAQEDMKRQKVAMEEYYAKQNGVKPQKADDVQAEAVNAASKVEAASS